MTTLLDILLHTAPFCTYLMFLSPIPTLYAKATTASIDRLGLLSFLASFLTGALWYTYAIMAQDFTVAKVSGTGAILQTIYMIVYLLYSQRKRSVLFSVSAVFGTFFLVRRYLDALAPTAALTQCGMMAAVVNVVAMGAPLAGLLSPLGYEQSWCGTLEQRTPTLPTPQVLATNYELQNEVRQSKSTESLPFPLILMTFLVASQWLAYAVIIEDYFQLVPNLCGVVLCVIQLSLFVIYPSKSKQT